MTIQLKLKNGETNAAADSIKFYAKVVGDSYQLLVIDEDGTETVINAATLANLTDTTINSPASGQGIVYNGTVWINQDIATQAELTAHINNVLNPHVVTKSQVGLANVTNILNNLIATTSPGVGDDSDDGYSVGSIWVDISGDAYYLCVDATVGAAVWASGSATLSDVAYNATSWNGNTDGATKNAIRDKIEALDTAKADASHNHAASEVTSGTFDNARVAEGNVTQHVGAIDHDSLLNTHNLTSAIDHNAITNTHNLTTAIDHDTITNNHNLTTDIDHDALTNFAVGEHRVINDAGTSATELWSASKINTVAGGKVDTGNVYREMWLDAGAAVPRTTNGAESATEEYATNDIMSDHMLFDGATEEAVQFRVAMPDSWNRGTIKVKVFWDAASGASPADGVVWGIRGSAISNDDAIDTAFGTEISVTDAVIVEGDLHVSAATAAITIGGTPALGDFLVLQVSRKTGDGGDTMTEDAKLLGIQVQYADDVEGSSAW